MKRLICSICDEFQEINHYDHDEPVLKCGHPYLKTNADIIIEIATSLLLPRIYLIMKEQHVSYEKAYNIILFS